MVYHVYDVCQMFIRVSNVHTCIHTYSVYGCMRASLVSPHSTIVCVCARAIIYVCMYVYSCVCECASTLQRTHQHRTHACSCHTHTLCMPIFLFFNLCWTTWVWHAYFDHVAWWWVWHGVKLSTDVCISHLYMYIHAWSELSASHVPVTPRTSTRVAYTLTSGSCMYKLKLLTSI